MIEHKGHALIEFKKFGQREGTRYFRCQRCKGVIVRNAGLGILDEDGEEIPPDDSKVPVCKGSRA